MWPKVIVNSQDADQIQIDKNDLNEEFIKSNEDDSALACGSIYDKCTISKFGSLKTIKDEIAKLLYGDKWNQIEMLDITKLLGEFSLDLAREDSNSDKQEDRQNELSAYPDPHLTLCARQPKQRLTSIEKLHIFKTINSDKSCLPNVLEMYNLSREWIRKIMKKYWDSTVAWLNYSTATKKQLLKSQIVLSTIESCFKSNSNPKTAKDVQNYIGNKTGIRVPWHLLKRYFKDEMRLSYKKGKSRPVSFDLLKQEYLKSLFSADICSKINNFLLLVNVDESSFSRSMKLNYSWIEKGEDNTITNIGFSSSISMWTAITSNGAVFSTVWHGSINSTIFMSFMTKLKEFINKSLNVSLSKTLVILDNASTHKSKDLREFYINEGFNVAFIPAYTPEFAPIEKHFARLKHLVLVETAGKRINWRKMEAFEILNRSISKISIEDVRSLWKTFIKELHNGLDNII